jgi:hypothetical protein
MAKSSDLLTGDLGYIAYFIGFIVVPIGLAIGGGWLGNDVLGRSVLGWVIGAIGFLVGLAIGKYAAFGALFAIGAGMMGGLAGLGIDWVTGSSESAVYWGLAIGGAGGFLFGVLTTLVADFSPTAVSNSVDAKLKEIAKGAPTSAALMAAIESLTESTTTEERLRIYSLIRADGILPPDATFFLFSQAAQWWGGWSPPEGESKELDSHTAGILRRNGSTDIAELYLHDRRGFLRRYEQGRQFFFGPPDEDLARSLPEKGVID